MPGAGRTLRFEILGRLRAWLDDEEIDLGPGKQRAVLAVLLLNANKPVSTTAIVDAVWLDDPPDNGANVVQKYVAGLRRVIEPDRSPRTSGELLPLTSAGYVLRVPADGLDSVVFQRHVQQALDARPAPAAGETATRLRAALAMWRGEVLAGLYGPVFDTARDRLAQERAAAIEACAEVELELGRHAQLVSELTRVVADFPLRERLRYLLILALYRSGRQAEALAAYRDARDFFAEEFGVEPGEPLQRLHLGILRSDPALARPSGEVMGPTGAATEATRSAATPGAMSWPGPASEPAGGASDPAPAVGLPLPSAAARGHVPDYGLGFSAPAAIPYRRGRGSRALKLSAIAIPVLSFGMCSWAVLAYYAGRRRSRRLALASLGYLALMVLVCVVVMVSRPEKTSALDGIGLAALLMAMFGGVAQVALLAFDHVPGPRDGLPQPEVEMVERRTRREQARLLLARHPMIAHELKIGRPDLPRTYDDGGLVDINSAPEHVLAALPGVDSYHAKLIVSVREGEGGSFATPEDLIVRGVLPAGVVRPLHEILVVVPAPAGSRHPADDPPR